MRPAATSQARHRHNISHNSVSPGTPVYEEGLSLEPQGIVDTHQARCQKEGHGHTATGSSRTLGLGINSGRNQEGSLTVFVT